MVRITFSENTPAWTKLGTAELFRILTDPQGKEKEIRKKAGESGIDFHMDPYWIEGQEEEKINEFMKFCAIWYTENKLSFNFNFDLLLEPDGESGWKISETPIPRPSTLKHVPSNVSNIKPTGTKDIKKEDLPIELREKMTEISKNGMGSVSAERLKNFKIYKERRFFEFKVISSEGKPDVCFSCGKKDTLTDTKETQHPLTVGIGEYSNFYSYHSGKIGFCRACSLSNHFAMGRVLYYVSGNSIFLGIPEASTIRGVLQLLLILEKAYESADLERRLLDYNATGKLLIDRSSIYKSNFISTKTPFSGFYFMILLLFSTLENSIELISRKLEVDIKTKDLNKSPLQKLLKEIIDPGYVHENLESIVFNSWSFILQEKHGKVRQWRRHWRYQGSIELMNNVKKLTTECGVKDLFGTVGKLAYKSGNNWLIQRREDFSRSLLLANPAIEILERYCWDKMRNGEKIGYSIRSIAECILIEAKGGKNMENEEVLKQCRAIGLSIAEVTINDRNKGLLYDLRSVGNAQSLRSYLERFTFKCSVMGIKTSMNNQFIEKLFEGNEWRKYKSIIAIVANQHYSHLNDKKKEVVVE